MKQLILSMIFVLSVIVSYSQTLNKTYPRYDEVVEKFFSNYQLPNTANYSQVKLQKKNSGWFIAISEYIDGEYVITQSEHFWNRKTNSYNKLKFKEQTNTMEANRLIKHYENDWSKRLYDICPYYGYVGWEADVFTEFGNKNDLSDTSLYAVGRAYSEYASNLLHNNFGYSNPEQRFNLSKTKNNLTDEQLKTYRKYRHKAIEKFNELYKRNPQFKILIGRIGVKTWNEHVTSYLDLLTFQNRKEALKELPKGLYNELYISMAKNFLTNCKPDAILFTIGDNDTYPLLYVQEIMNFRTDVTVVNISLFQTIPYINCLIEGRGVGEGLPVSFTSEQIKNKKRDIVYLKQDDDEYVSINKIVDYLKNDLNVEKYRKQELYTLKTKKWQFRKENDTLKWRCNKNYLTRADILLLDVIATNKWERPICFTTSFRSTNLLGMQNYLKYDGMVLSLTSHKKDIQNDYNIGYINSEELYDFVMKKADWSGIDDLSVHEIWMHSSYRIMFTRLAQEFIKKLEFNKAHKVLDKCIELIPNEKIPYDYYTSEIIKAYYEIGDFKKANQLVKRLLENIKDKSIHHGEKPKERHTLLEKALLDLLKNMAEKYEQSEILNLIISELIEYE